MTQSGAADAAAGDGFWDLYSRVYDAVYQLMPYRAMLWDTYQALDLRDGMRVLDAGCGTGNFEHFIHQKNPPRVTIDAIDFSHAMLDRAQAKNAALENATFSWGNLAEPLPFPDATFDCIVSINVLYALPDPDFTTRELLRVLKPDGVLVITSPAPEFAVTNLVADHYRRVKNIWGIGRKVSRVVSSTAILLASGVAQWALNNFVINRRETDGAYHSLDMAEFEALLDRRRTDGLEGFRVSRALAEQNIFAVATKAATA